MELEGLLNKKFFMLLLSVSPNYKESSPFSVNSEFIIFIRVKMRNMNIIRAKPKTKKKLIFGKYVEN